MRRWTPLLPYLPYLLLSLLIVGPLLAPGYVLTMDMVFTPQLRLPPHVDNTWLLYAILHALDWVLPADVVQKLVLLVGLLLAGVGAHRLLLAIGKGQAYWRWAVYVGGVLYVVNPFVYDRLMAGQWGVLLGYSLLPWFIMSLYRFGREPSWPGLFGLTVWVVAMSIVSIHSLGYVALFGAIAVVVRAHDWRPLVRFGAVGVLIFMAASAYWLVPTLMGQGRIAGSLATFTSAGQHAFATVDAVGTGQIGAVLGLLGFWQETRGLYVQPIESHMLWGLVYMAVLGLLVIGVWQAWRQQREIALVATVVALMATVLAIGLAALLAAGYREPQKFVAVLALTYVYFVAWGAVWLLGKLRAKRLVAAGLIVLILSYTPTLLWGGGGQLRPTDYPADWYTAKHILAAQPNSDKVLMLPWHLYMSYSFTHGRIIASPAHTFFDREIVASDDPELPGVVPQTRDSTREIVQSRILPAVMKGEPVAQRLREIGVGYVLLSKDLDWTEYASIARQPGVQLLHQGVTLDLYKLTK